MPRHNNRDDNDKGHALLRDAIESLAEAFALFDEVNCLVLFNRRYREMNRPIAGLLQPGLDWEILLLEAGRRGMHFHVAGQKEEWVPAYFSDTLDHVQDLELEIGDGRSYLVSLHPTKSGGFAVTGTDNTLRKQAESVERDSELLFTTVLESNPASVVMVRMSDGAVIYRSKAARKLLGDKKFAKEYFIIPEERIDYLTALLADGGIDDYRVTLVNAAGRQFPASISGRITEFKGEDVVVSTTIDLTTQVEANALIRQVLEACPVPIQMTDVETGKLLFVSPESTALFGSVDSSKSYYADPAEREKYIRELRERGWVKNRRAEFRNGSGKKFWGAVSSRLISFQGQEVIVSNTRDLTDDLIMQDELEHQRELLYQNEKMSALGELLAGVAHELNNPLTIVVGHSMMLLEDVEDPQTHKRIEKISDAAERCAKIVKTFLAMARQQPTKMEVTDINAVVKTAVDVAGYGHASETLEIVSGLDGELPCILADADQITQVLINLIINAEQAITKAGVGDRIDVSTVTTPAGDYIEIFVTDNGPGIADNIRARIFEPFFTTKDVGDGTGIGLAFCHRIILSHGGQIWLDPEHRHGSRFGIRLPVTAASESADQTIPAAARVAGHVAILVVDDEVEVGELASMVLAKQGYQVDVVNSGLEALKLLEKNSYDVVLSDLNMPGVDGRGIYDSIRRDYPDLLEKLAFMTGDTMGSASQHLLKESKRPYLEKPVSPADLRQLVEGLLSQQQGEQ